MIRRTERHHFVILATILIVLLIAENTQLFGIYLDYITMYFFKLSMWGALGVVVRFYPPVIPIGLLRMRSTITGMAFIFSAFYLLCFIFIGIFTSFAKNTYDMTPLGILSNIAAMVAVLVGAEKCRSFLINSLSKNRPYLVILCSSIVFALFNMSLGNIKGLSSNLDILDYLINIIFPQIIQSVVASCLVYLAGPAPAMIYLGLIRLFFYVSPFIPNPSEMVKLLFNVLFPLISLSVIARLYFREASSSESKTQKMHGILSWSVVGVLSVAIVWFAVGIFPVFPSVILTGSMEPDIMPGDIVLVDKRANKDVEVDDVVMYYSEDGIYITHRIIEKISYLGDIKYMTKGDNNINRDAAYVQPGQIKGKIIGVIPDIGKLMLLLRDNINH